MPSAGSSGRVAMLIGRHSSFEIRSGTLCRLSLCSTLPKQGRQNCLKKGVHFFFETPKSQCDALKTCSQAATRDGLTCLLAMPRSIRPRAFMQLHVKVAQSSGLRVLQRELGKKSKGSPIIRDSAFLCCYLRRRKHSSCEALETAFFTKCSDMRNLVQMIYHLK